ncbi:hypothetical protein MMC30_007788 [Trapelia coarctata]|nr:hypothetical protein [Trapelia coarctata]
MGSWVERAYDFFAAVMIRRFAHEPFHRKPSLDAGGGAAAMPVAADWRAELAEKRKSAAQGIDALYRACSYSLAFHHTLFLASLPGLVDLPQPLSQNVEWLLSTNLKSANLSEWEFIQQHPAYEHINTIFSGSGKIDQLRRLLEIARGDCSSPNDGAAVVLKKHNLRADWNVQLILGFNVHAGDRQKIINNAFPNIPANGGSSDDAARDVRPGLLITTMGACGTGMNGMEKASYGVVFDGPFSKSHVKQAKGRIYRAKQRHPSHFYVLWSANSEAEDLFHQRHCNREQAFRSILDACAARPQISPSAETTLWHTWVVAEGVRRTWMVAHTVDTIERLLRDGTGPCSGSLMFTTRKGAWDADSAFAWIKICAGSDAGFIHLGETDELFRQPTPVALDEFAKIMIKMNFRTERMKRWMDECDD